MQAERILRFSYSMELDFSEPVQKHQFTLRMIPQSDERQQIAECSIEILPKCRLNKGTDAFGNQYVYGDIEQPHSRFLVEVQGAAHIKSDRLVTNDKPLIELASYRFPSPYTRAGSRLKEYYQLHARGEDEDKLVFAERLLHQLYQDMKYVQGVTDIRTTAEEALMGGQGVCQDYAHIMITLCRMADIPSRYVVGMMQGEGYSHAWVEVCVNGKWYGMDPTNDRVVDNTYVKISHGRDYQDCIVNRGVFQGLGTQTQIVRVVVQEE